MNLSPETLERMTREADGILREELEREGLNFDKSKVRIYDNIRTVGVMGDNRSYEFVAEITLSKDGKFIWDSVLLSDGEDFKPGFISRLSTTICNKVKGINRVVYNLYPLD